MVRVIVATGRGGTGKTSFVALATRYLETPQLLIDADPDQSLAAMLGVDLAAASIKTISDVLYDIQISAKKNRGQFNAMPLVQKIEYLLHMNCLYESADFDMLGLGVKWTKGCYCHPNDILRAILPELARSYACTVIDSPAGLEHLNRRIISQVDDVFAIMDPSAKSVQNVERIKQISEQVGIRFHNLYLVANHRFSKDQAESLANIPGTKYLGRIPYDVTVEEYDWAGKSLLELPATSPASAATGEILNKAGYRGR